MGCVLSCLANGTFMTWGDNHLTTDEFRLFLMCLKSAHQHAHATQREGSSTVTKTDIKQHIQQHFYLFAGKQTTRVEALIERTCDMFLPVLTATDPKDSNADVVDSTSDPNTDAPRSQRPRTPRLSRRRPWKAS